MTAIRAITVVLLTALAALPAAAQAPAAAPPAKPALKPSAPTPALLPLAPTSSQRLDRIDAVEKQVACLAAEFGKGIHVSKLGEAMPYRLFRPRVERGKKYPLVLFLHDVPGSGTENEKQLQGADALGALVWALPDVQRRHPCFVLAPQTDVGWASLKLQPGRPPEVLEGFGPGVRQAIEIVEELVGKEPVDRARIYVTGQCMGGTGTWNVVSQRPDLFAAAVPISGRANLGDLAVAYGIPLWAFIGLKDGDEPVDASRAILAAIQAEGGNPLYTEYPNVGHDAFRWAYTEPALVEWLFAQNR